MKKGLKITLILLAVLILLLGIGPFLVPVPPLENTTSIDQIAPPDSTFIEINDLSIHYEIAGEGEPVFVLLHGFGASLFSWREVIGPLSEIGTVIAYDRPAFGLTERPVSWSGTNPYSQESNFEILSGLLDAFDVEKAILIGNSAGGTLATSYALEHPERVRALVEVDAAIYQTKPDSQLLQWLFETPQLDHLGPLIARRLAGASGEDFIRSAWYDPSQLDKQPEILAGYRLPLQINNWDLALWEFTKVSPAANLAEHLDQISIPSLVISGRNDQIVPLENSIRLAEDLPVAQLKIIEDCGHVPQEECPAAFIQIVTDFLSSDLYRNGK